jgi:hypothetical protein
MQPLERPVESQPEASPGGIVQGHSSMAFSMGNVDQFRLDYHEEHIHRQQAPAVAQGQFFSLSLEDYGSRRWVDPPQARELVRLLEEHHLLILSGDLDEKKECAYHIVHQLRERLQARGEKELPVLEKCSGRDPQKIEAALDDEEPRILLLSDISPRQIVGQTPVTLRNLLRAHRSYAILTTENERADWEIVGGSLESRLWYELSWESYYGVDLLRDFLGQQLRDSKDGVPEPLLSDPDGLFLIEDLDLRSVVARLRTPSKIRIFCEWLLKSRGPLTKTQVEDQLGGLGGDEQSVGRWYRQFDARQQLLILGLTLFDGLPDETLFTGLELLVENIWRSSDPSIPQFDYGDLVHCAAYFKKVETKHGQTRIRSSSQERRQQILKLVWSHQRRRLLLALPVLREMIRISAASEEDGNGQLSGPSTAGIQPADAAAARREAAGRVLNRSEQDTLQLHQALVDSLGLISRLSTEVVEQHFLELAADASDSVQRLAARALSIWRDDNHEQELLSLLDDWWREACEPWNAGSRIARLGRKGQDPFAAVRAAVGLTVGYAARFDRENQLTSRLYELLARVLEDHHPRVRYAAAQALELAVAWHFRQLEPLLRMRVLQSDNFLAAVGRGAAEACSLRTEETVAILDNWRAIARAEKRRSSPHRVSNRERLLATVALAYGEIRPDRGDWPLGPEILCANLRSILMEEFHPFVRRYAFAAIERQALQNFELVVQLLQDLLSQIHLQDRPAVVEIFAKTYLHQRQRLSGGDRRVEVEERRYEVWMESPRPLTEIEATLYGWLLDSGHPIVQQIAVDVFDRLGRTSLEVEERAMRARRPVVARNELPAGDFGRKPKSQVRRLPVLGYAAIFCTAPRKPQVRVTLRPLLAEIVALKRVWTAPKPDRRKAAPQPLEFPKPPATVLLERWNTVANDSTKAVAGLLRRALFFYNWRWLFIGMVLLLGVGLYYGTPIIYHLIQERRAIAQSQATGIPASPTPTSEPSPAPTGP